MFGIIPVLCWITIGCALLQCLDYNFPFRLNGLMTCGSPELENLVLFCIVFVWLISVCFVLLCAWLSHSFFPLLSSHFSFPSSVHSATFLCSLLCSSPLLPNLFLFYSPGSSQVLVYASFPSALLCPFQVRLSTWVCVCLLECCLFLCQ